MCPPLDMIAQLRAGNLFLDGFRHSHIAFVAFSDDGVTLMVGRRSVYSTDFMLPSMTNSPCSPPVSYCSPYPQKPRSSPCCSTRWRPESGASHGVDISGYGLRPAHLHG